MKSITTEPKRHEIEILAIATQPGARIFVVHHEEGTITETTYDSKSEEHLIDNQVVCGKLYRVWGTIGKYPVVKSPRFPVMLHYWECDRVWREADYLLEVTGSFERFMREKFPDYEYRPELYNYNQRQG